MAIAPPAIVSMRVLCKIKIIAILRVRIPDRFLKIRMLVRKMIYDNVNDDLDVSGMGLANELGKRFKITKGRVNTFIVEYIILMI